ncbi:MAG TPA: MFS transporter [Synergistales bacterium]|nr:MFS transporter [Synergistales bacterium]
MTGLLKVKGLDSQKVSWCLYDVGNSAYATTIMAAVYPVFFREVAGATLPGTLPTAYWGYASSIALLCSAILAPFLGTLADLKGSKKRLLGLFTMLGISSTALMSTVDKGEWFFALLLLVLSSIGFSAAIIFYDSLLPHIVPVSQMDLLSAQGFAFGYLGGGLLLGFNLLMIRSMPALTGIKLSFISVAIWWLFFTIPIMIKIPEPAFVLKKEEMGTSTLISTYIRLRNTFAEIRRYREVFKFLLAFWLYNDGIGTIIRMAAIYGSQVGISMTSLVGALLLTQFVGVPFSLLFGKMAGKVGGKRSIMIALLWYFGLSIGAVFLNTQWHFWALAVGVGMVQGGAQALSRSVYASMLPKLQSAEFFGFYDISSKFAGIIGPALFGLITQLTGSSRIGIGVLSLTFVLGMLILAKVDVEKGRTLVA